LRAPFAAPGRTLSGQEVTPVIESLLKGTS
jgi:hypothetical protein